MKSEEQSIWGIGEYEIKVIQSGPPWKENCYLVRHLASDEQAVIDPGDRADVIIQAIHASGSNLRYVWLTHAHHDHVGSVAAICRQFGLVCDIHKDDVRLLRHAPMYALRFAGKNIESAEPFRVFETPFQFQLGGRSVEVIHTPGHTQGSVSYVLDGSVFTGDTLLYKHVGRTDLPGGDAGLLKNSINTLLETLRGDTVIFSGHGRPWMMADARVWWLNNSSSPSSYFGTET